MNDWLADSFCIKKMVEVTCKAFLPKDTHRDCHAQSIPHQVRGEDRRTPHSEWRVRTSGYAIRVGREEDPTGAFALD